MSKLISLVFITAVFSIQQSYAQDAVADNILLYQRGVGGWPKHIGEQKIDYTKPLSPAEKAGLVDDKNRNDATIDNNATTKEIRYLVKAFKQTGNKDYLTAAENGISYLLKMQYANGGFPQFYPDTSLYRSEITYNDNAMINALNILWDVAHRKNGFDVIEDRFVEPSQKAVDRGISCILKTQINRSGKLTAWCAQYDKRTLKPAKARSFELISLSGDETVGIVEFLMKVEHPSADIIQSIDDAVQWFQSSKIEGYTYVDITDPSQPNGRDRVIRPDASSTIWARFYDIDTNRPFFCGRDGVKKWSVAEIENERRTGYGWYGTWPKDLLEKEYPQWKMKNKS